MHDKNYSYINERHASLIDEKGGKYCRMADSTLPFSVRRCSNCPLWSGHCAEVFCLYYDIISPDDRMEKSSVQSKKYTRGLISAGVVPRFPDFISENGVWHSEFATYEKALQFAAIAHHGNYRKGTKVPYIVHPVEASMIVYELCCELGVPDTDYVVMLMSAAALHDVAEDTKYTLTDIYERFGARIADIVTSESENKRENIPAQDSWKIRKEEALAHFENAPREAQIVAFGDKLSNMRDMASDYERYGNDMWAKFNQTDKRQHAWYYRSIGDILSKFKGTHLYDEYVQLCNDVFGDLDA